MSDFILITDRTLDADPFATLPMILHCPECSGRHIDEGAFAALARPTPDGEIGELEEAAFALLNRRYVQRADSRQQSMGLQYTEAETHDLAKLVARFAADRLETQAADIARLQEALEAAVFALRNNGYPETAAELERAATRTDVR